LNRKNTKNYTHKDNKQKTEIA